MDKSIQTLTIMLGCTTLYGLVYTNSVFNIVHIPCTQVLALHSLALGQHLMDQSILILSTMHLVLALHSSALVQHFVDWSILTMSITQCPHTMHPSPELDTEKLVISPKSRLSSLVSRGKPKFFINSERIFVSRGSADREVS